MSVCSRVDARTEADPTEPGTEHPALSAPVRFVPLPVYATLPNEGATYGVMPVFLDYEGQGSRISSITAPSVTWNGVSHYTATARHFRYPNDFEEQIFQFTYATRLYREAIAEWTASPMEQGRLTHALSFQYRRDPYRRFFGIGPDTSLSDETTYTLDSARAYGRVGYNVAPGLNLNVTVGVNHYTPVQDGVLGIRSTFESFPDIAGLRGATSTSALFGVRYDTRPIREYSTSGMSLEAVHGGGTSTVSKSGVYGIEKYEAKILWEEFARLGGAARFYHGRVYGADVPYYERQSLGGSFFMRGFILDRFVDDAAWTVDFEQRITAAIIHLQGSVVHVRIDPFINVGQVYHGTQDVFRRVRFTEGVGIRAFAPPNVIGRIDVARNPVETNVYVELGYPF